MICVTGGERTVSALAARLTRHEAAALQEVRLDLLEPFDDAVFQLLGSPRIIVTCRGEREGGAFSGSHDERRSLLTRALAQRPGYLDLERTIPGELRRELFDARGECRMILSWHDHRPGGLSRLPADLTRDPADVLKIAVQVDDAADLAPLLAAAPRDDIPCVKIGMGAAGLLSRALYPRFGSPWTYVAADGASATAAGQLTAARAARWRIAEANELTPLGLIGGPGAASSPGPRIYNRLFARRRLPFLYLPVITARPAEALALAEALGFGGCSVTMPAKEVLARLADRIEAPAAGAVNTILFRQGQRVGLNTDVPAVAGLLSGKSGQPALVLGTGGAARAAALALQQISCPVTVTGRSPERTAALAAALDCGGILWEERGGEPFQVLVNATPCGADGESDPMPSNVSWQGRTVLDAVMSPPATPLLSRVRAGGGVGIGGLGWWFAQGALQVEAMTEAAVSARDLEELERADG